MWLNVVGGCWLLLWKFMKLLEGWLLDPIFLFSILSQVYLPPLSIIHYSLPFCPQPSPDHSPLPFSPNHSAYPLPSHTLFWISYPEHLSPHFFTPPILLALHSSSLTPQPTLKSLHTILCPSAPTPKPSLFTPPILHTQHNIFPTPQPSLAIPPLPLTLHFSFLTPQPLAHTLTSPTSFLSPHSSIPLPPPLLSLKPPSLTLTP